MPGPFCFIACHLLGVVGEGSDQGAIFIVKC